ncbi:histidine kinase [Fluviicola sp.]|uniref:tetratricopeptide repeat-containing sensor histidine kinase n=1 Tax=Fluviicola sp. TaxID=1917219 RepID=UPI00261B89AC|nr:histidine kinase [Fluviicola sp.]
MNFFEKSGCLQKVCRSVVVALFCIFAGSSYAQPPLDSLLRKVRYQNDDTLKANLYYDIGIRYALKDRDLFKTYSDSLQRLSRKLNYSKGTGLAYSAYGYYYCLEKDWPKMKVNLQKSDSIFEKLNETSKLMTNKGVYTLYYKYNKEFDKELQLCLEILHYNEQKGLKSEEGKILGRIAIVLQQLKRYNEAKGYYLRSIRVREEIKDFNGKSITLLNLGGMLAEQKRFTEAEPYLDETLRLQETLKQQNVIIFCKANLAHVYIETGRPRKALELATECGTYYEAQKDTFNLVKLGLYQALAYTKLKKFDQALSVLKEKHRLVKNNPIYATQEANLLWEYYKVYKAMGKTDVALEYFEEANELREQNQNMDVQLGVSRMKEEYETEKKQRENEQLKKDNELKDLQISQRNYLIFGSILLLLLISIIAFIMIRNNKLKSKNIAIEMEQRLLQSQMNPHFIFNVLHAIHTYMLKKDTEESGKLLTSFARLVRSILQHSSKDSIPLSEELNWLRDYIRLQQLRFTDTFNYTIEIDEELSSDNVLLPPMLIQPFIENAIEHGFQESNKSGELHISYKKIGEEVEIRIADNGKGFSGEDLARGEKEHESLAVQITEKRINLLNKKRNGAFKFNISSKPKEGTLVLFSIPYQTLFD